MNSGVIYQLLAVDGEAKSLQHGDEDSNVFSVGWKVAKRQG